MIDATDVARIDSGALSPVPLNPFSVGLQLFWNLKQKAARELSQAVSTSDEIFARAKLASVTAAFDATCEATLLQGGPAS